MRYRKERMQDFIREEISDIIQKEIKDPGLGFITIIDVRMTDDLKYAKIYYSVFGTDEEVEKTVDALGRARGYIKHILGKRISLRYMPDISFLLDRSEEKARRIDQLIEKVKTDDVHEG